MTEKTLDEAYVDAILDQERRRGVAKHVGCDAALNRCARDKLVDSLSQGLRRKRVASRIKEEGSGAISGVSGALRDDPPKLAPESLVGDEHCSLSRALTDHAERHAVGAHVERCEGAQFADA